MQTPDVTKNQIAGLLTPLATALVSFGAFNNTKAAAIVTIVSGVGSIGLFAADAVIRAHRSKMHGAQLSLYLVGKLESLVAQGVDVNKILGGNTVAAVADGVDHTVPPPAADAPQPGDVDYIPPVSAAQPPPEPAVPQPPATMGAGAPPGPPNPPEPAGDRPVA